MLTQSHFIALAPLITVSVTSVLLTLAIAFKRHHTFNATIAVIGLNIALVSVLMVLPNPQYVTDLLSIDRYAAVGMALMLVCTLGCCTFGHAYQLEQCNEREEMYLLFLLAVIGGLVMVCSRHFAALFIGMEILSIPLYGLVAYNLKQKRSLEAGIKYLILSAAGSAIMLFGIALIYAHTGSLSFPHIGNQITQAGNVVSPLLQIGAALVLVAFAFKLSLVPFHLWTPDVYEGAPVPVTAFLATAAKIAVAMAMLRMMAYLPVFTQPALVDIMSVLAIVSILAGNLLAMMQNNLKRLLAYSSIAHFGYLMVAVAVFNFATLEATIVYLVSYSLATLASFGVITMVSLSDSQQNREGIDADGLHRYRGLFWKQPYLAAIMTVSLLSLAGIPMTVGFIGKFYVILAAVNQSAWFLLAAIVIGSAIGLYYYLRVIVTLYMPDPGMTRYVAAFNWSRTAGGIVLVLTAFMTLLWGILPDTLLTIAMISEFL